MKYSKLSSIYKLFNLALAIVFFTGSVMSQETRGTIFGTVTDPNGAAVAGAAVAITNVATNVSTQVTTNESGAFEAPYLLPGTYSVVVTASGYKKVVQQSVTLPVNERVPVDVKLEVGTLTEEVIVTADASPLDTTSPNASTSLNSQEISSLPTPYNNVFALLRNAPGVNVTDAFSPLGPHSTAGAAGVNTAGGIGGNEYSIDGVPNLGKERRPASLPFVDTVAEMKIETAFFDASKGHTTGINQSILTKNGTNNYHGSLSWQHWQQRWNGTPISVRRGLKPGEQQASGRSNNWSATIGGPVQLPRFGEGGPAIWNGKDKLFFFFFYNGMKEVKTEPDNIRTVPTLKQRQGDFSELLALDSSKYQIWDPRSSSVVGGNPTRNRLFANNQVPILNPLYQHYLRFIPLPNAQGTREGLNNFIGAKMPWNQDYKAVGNRIDYQISENHKMFVKWSWNDFLEDRRDWTYETIRGLNSEPLFRRNWGVTIDEVTTINPTTYLNISVAYNRFADGFASLPAKTLPPSSVGLPSYLDERAGAQQHLPRLDFASVSDFGLAYPDRNFYNNGILRGELSKLMGQHTLKIGGEGRTNIRSNYAPNFPAGTFSFDNTYVRRASNTPGTQTSNIGLDWAAFALGVPSSISLDTRTDLYLTNRSYAGYVQDDWRITPRLTLNLGIRYEIEGGMRERFNRGIAGYDLNAELPISGAVEAAYARSPLPEMPASQFDVRGGTLYLGTNGTPRTVNESKGEWMPRFGAAYKLTEKTVIRGGYGIFYDTINPLNLGLDQSGYNRSTSPILGTISGTTFTFNNTNLTTPACQNNPSACVTIFSDPFYVRPDGTRFNEPLGSSLGLMSKAGTNFTFGNRDWERARQQRWRISLQQELTNGIVAEAAYLGSYADNINVSKRLNPLPEQYWSSGMIPNPDNQRFLTGNVTNPFDIKNLAFLETQNPTLYNELRNNGTFNNTQIARHRLLRAFPQHGELIDSRVPDGEVKHHELQLSVQKRLSKGVAFMAAHTWAYSLERLNYLNEFDEKPSWRINNDTRPHHLLLSGIYELPFGRGKRFFSDNKLIGSTLGGWAISGVYHWQTGPAIDLGNWVYYGKDLRELQLSGDERGETSWFNWQLFPGASRDYDASKPEAVAAYRNRIRQLVPQNMLPTGKTYENVVPSDFQLQSFHRRIFPSRLNWVRADAARNLDLSLMRRFAITERSRFELKVDFINALNGVFWSNPSTNIDSSNFAVSTSQRNTPRIIQFQGRFNF